MLQAGSLSSYDLKMSYLQAGRLLGEASYNPKTSYLQAGRLLGEVLHDLAGWYTSGMIISDLQTF